ncbi:Cytochrome P450 [Mycena chlorophos]|uniref:Cytochrome P450 n=1 Tax=Mycena chlorophos TaxID=658473 RepID=A0A8H6SVX0_MYCCL|nr:Cytochrome P450 [Mycena chlorophos]
MSVLPFDPQRIMDFLHSLAVSVSPSTAATAAALASAYLLIRWRNSGLDRIPAIGPTGLITSFFGAQEYLRNAPKVVQKGYNMYKNGVFRVPYYDKWVVVVGSQQLVYDLRSSRDEDLSAILSFGAIFAAKWTLGESFITNDYHTKVIQGAMTRSISERFLDVKEEIGLAFEDELKFTPGGDEWITVLGLQTVLRVISRASNRLFVGAPLCRDPDYRDLTVNFAIGAMNSAKKINLFPHWLKPIVGPLITTLPRDLEHAKRHLVPIIEERLRLEAEHGPNWPDRPSDLISWLLEYAEGEERTPHELTRRMLMVNFVAIHTSANSFTQALFHLAHEPHYAGPLREELAAAVAEDGWTKAAMSKCIKLDSFLRESQRFNGASAVNINRIVVNPNGFTFSDGTHLPQGTFLTAATHATHHDPDNYADPEVFDGFRFAKMRLSEEGGMDKGSIKLQMVAPDVKYLSFGLGRHACPGRFFAVNELKLMLAYILEHYDVKLESPERPPTEWFGTLAAANRFGKVMFRKRTDI